jgi:hypothetical protein
MKGFIIVLVCVWLFFLGCCLEIRKKQDIKGNGKRASSKEAKLNRNKDVVKRIVDFQHFFSKE